MSPVTNSVKQGDPLPSHLRFPRCSVEAECGACQLLTVSYDEQLRNKQQEVRDLFAHLIDSSSVCYPIGGMAYPYFYRNKVMSPFTWGKKIHPRGGSSGFSPTKQKGTKKQNPRQSANQSQAIQRQMREILCGMYAAGSHRIIPSDSCVIENETAKHIILAIRDLMSSFRIEPYQEDSHTGFLRHVVVRVGHETQEVLVTLVTNAKQFPRSKDFCRTLIKRCPAITTVVQNINTRQTNVILGETETTLYGSGFILDKLCGLSFRISSTSFYQVNPVQAEVLYQKAIEMAKLKGTETLVDAYCGTGTIGLVAAKGLPGRAGAAQVIGVDKVASAIRDARNNAKHNGIKNAEFVVADAGDFFREIAHKFQEAKGSTGELPGDSRPFAPGAKFGSYPNQQSRQDNSPSLPPEDTSCLVRGASSVDVVVMDPPRSGASEDFLKALVMLLPCRVIYISCNPATQRRDLSYLIARGYRIEAMQALDMFPHTSHIENIVSLKRC